MNILLTGGGSGGHITPLLAVARKLKDKDSSVRLHYVGEKGSKFAHISAAGDNLFDIQSSIYAGKFRRYNGESWISRLIDLPTLFLNIRDAFFVLAGFLQSIIMLIRHRPDTVFIKGGYVGLPLGIASRLLRIDYITHDSDAISGLTNRVVGKGAIINAVGMPSGSYPYNPKKIVVSGVPVSPDFRHKYDVAALKKQFGIAPDFKLLLITGGSNGAKRVNQAMAKVVPQLIEQDEKLVVAHMMGKGNLGEYGNFSSDRLIKIEFAHNLFEFSAAADLIITRAGANSIAEFAVQSKPCILIPNPYLTGGHQLRNAAAIKKIGGAEVLYESDMLNSPEVLRLIQGLLAAKPKLLSLGKNLHKAFPENADSILADLLLKRNK